MKGKPWSDREKETATNLFRQGLSYRDIGLALGRTNTSVEGYFRWKRMPESERQLRRERARIYAREFRRMMGLAGQGFRKGAANVVTAMEPDPIAIADRDRRAELSPKDLTALLCGDPLPGMSALDRR